VLAAEPFAPAIPGFPGDFFAGDAALECVAAEQHGAIYYGNRKTGLFYRRILPTRAEHQGSFKRRMIRAVGSGHDARAQLVLQVERV